MNTSTGHATGHAPPLLIGALWAAAVAVWLLMTLSITAAAAARWVTARAQLLAERAATSSRWQANP